MFPIEQISSLATRARRIVLEMNHIAGAGHTGSDLSEIDILCTLWGNVLQRSCANPLDNDRFILSKAHGAGGFYATLMALGLLDSSLLNTYQKEGSLFPGHPVRQSLLGLVEINAGALGHGLPVAVGLTLAKKLRNNSGRVFVLLGDGELAEGSNWEALMNAAKYRLGNLFIIVDRNRLQLASWTEEIMPLEPLAEKLQAFGAMLETCDGHSPKAILSCIERHEIKDGDDKPCVILAQTCKGKGISFMENDPAWHHRVPNQEELRCALEELV